MFHKAKPHQYYDVPTVRFVDLHPNLQADLMNTTPRMRSSCYKLVGCASQITNRPPHLIAREDIMTQNVVAIFRELFEEQKPDLILGCRQLLRLFGNDTLVPYKRKFTYHAWLKEWEIELTVRLSEKQRLRGHCASFLTWWTSTFFPQYAPYEVPMALLQREHFIQFRRYLIKRVSTGQLTAVTAAKYLRVPIRWIEWMQKSRGRLCSLDLTGITILRGENKARMVPTHSEISIFLDGIKNTSTRHSAANIYFTLLVSTGARPIEIADVTFARVHEESQSIVLQSKRGPFRYLPLPPNVWIMLQKYIRDIHGELRNPSQVILRQQNGAPITYKWIRLRYLRALKYCGLRFDGLLAFRHRFATDCLEAGLDHNTTRYLLGHQDASHLSRYQHAEMALISKSVNSAFREFNWEGKS